MHVDAVEVVHGTRRRADDDARRRRGGIHEFAEPVRVLEGLVMYKPHRAAHQMGRADLLAPRVVVRVARGDLKVVGVPAREERRGDRSNLVARERGVGVQRPG